MKEVEKDWPEGWVSEKDRVTSRWNKEHEEVIGHVIRRREAEEG